MTTLKKKVFALSGVFLLLISVYITGYAVASSNKAFRKDIVRNYTVSNAIGNGQREATAVLSFTATLCIIISLYYTDIYKNSNNVRYITMFLLLLIGSLFVSIIYINPLIIGLSDKKEEDYDKKHPILAVAAFFLVLFYTLLTSTLMYKYLNLTYRQKVLLGIIVFINIVGFIICLASAVEVKKWGIETSRGMVDEKLFEISENIQVIALLMIILYIAFVSKTKDINKNSFQKTNPLNVNPYHRYNLIDY